MKRFNDAARPDTLTEKAPAALDLASAPARHRRHRGPMTRRCCPSCDGAIERLEPSGTPVCSACNVASVEVPETLIEDCRRQARAAAILGLPAHQRSVAFWLREWRRLCARNLRERRTISWRQRQSERRERSMY